jgi:regulator of sigma E protease
MLEMLQNILVYGGSFVAVLSVVVFVHEFGHFQIGRWCGVAVKSFSIGLGPEWFGWTDKYGTRWKISRVPLGGFVSWIDDTDGSSTLPASDEHQGMSTAEARKRGHFRAMPVWRRAAIVAAGPLTNFVFAILALAVWALIVGRDVTDYAALNARIGEVAEGSAAAAGGLRSGDVVRAVNGAPVANWGALQETIRHSPGHALTLTIQRVGAEQTTVVTPQAQAAPGGGDIGVLGVSLGVRDEDYVTERLSPVQALNFGAFSTWDIVARTGVYIGGFFSGQSSGREIAGPLGILNASGQVAAIALDGPDHGLAAKIGDVALALLRWAAVLSVAVGFANLLPIPVLDGGHLLFYGVEALRGGRPLPPIAQEWAFRAGFAIMASLFLFATWNDITRLFPGAQ